MFSYVFVGIRVFSCVFVGIRGFSWVFVGFRRFSWVLIAMDIRRCYQRANRLCTLVARWTIIENVDVKMHLRNTCVMSVKLKADDY